MGGVAATYNFPLNAEYVIRAELWETNAGAERGALRRAENGPYFFEVMIDDERVYTAPPVGGKKTTTICYVFEAPARHQEQPKRDRYANARGHSKRAHGNRPRGGCLAENADVHAPQEPCCQPLERASTENYPFEGFKCSSTSTGCFFRLIGGPFNPTGSGDTPSRRRVLLCRPTSAADEPACARRIITALARRAYRRPVTDADLRPLLAFYQTGRQRASFESGISLALRRILADPAFLFRFETDPAGAAAGTGAGVTDLELASRLSFFLWSSIPDEQLLDVASQGQLRNPAVLERQVRRMLADPKSHALVQTSRGSGCSSATSRSQLPNAGVSRFRRQPPSGFRQETEMLFEQHHARGPQRRSTC